MESQPNSTESDENISPEEVQMAFDSAEKKAAEVQEQHIQAAQYAGYTREVIHVTAPFYVHLAQIAEDKPQLRPFVASGVHFINSLENELDQTSDQVRPLLRSIYSISSSAHTFVTTSGSASLSLSPSNEEIQSYEAPPFFAPDQTTVEKKLSLIDPSLADTYREIGQAYHGTTADPARGAIGLMRQVFDHFFYKLASDDAVRDSPYWKPKSGSEPNHVTRRERMTYAAHTHIRDQARAETIIANIDHILETYQILNSLHKRGALSTKQARSALKTMKKFIETWVDAMEL
jgi:hypothetical protein